MDLSMLGRIEATRPTPAGDSAAVITPAVERLIGKFAAWLDKPWKTATQIDAGNLLNVLRIHARFMHGCRDLENEASARLLQRDYGNPASWKQLHAASQDADELAELAWTEAMVDADRAFAALTGTNSHSASPGRSIPVGELLNGARRFTLEVAA